MKLKLLFLLILLAVVYITKGETLQVLPGLDYLSGGFDIVTTEIHAAPIFSLILLYKTKHGLILNKLNFNILFLTKYQLKISRLLQNNVRLLFTVHQKKLKKRICKNIIYKKISLE